jgi:glycosyltransferase involved in cell wall biosynthesis
MSVPCLWVVCPSYDDVAAFTVLRERLREVVAASGLSFAGIEFVLVDDTGGADPNARLLDELDDVTVLDPPFNLGHQRALVFGVRTVSGRLEEDDVVVTLDSDGEDQPEDLPRLLAPLLASGDLRKVVLARRTKRRESIPFRVLYVAFRAVFRLLTGTVVRTGNFAAYRGWTAKHVLRHPYFDLSYSSTFLSLPLELEFVPCERGERYAGRSRMGYGRLIMHGLGMLMPFTDRVAVRALVTFAVTTAAGVGLALAVVCVKLFTDRAIPGWATSTLLLLLVVSLVALGNFVVLFVVFSQSRGMSLADVEEAADGRARASSRAADRART